MQLEEKASSSSSSESSRKVALPTYATPVAASLENNDHEDPTISQAVELLDVEDIVRKVIGNRSDLHRSVQKIDAVEDYKSIEGQADDD